MELRVWPKRFQLYDLPVCLPIQFLQRFRPRGRQIVKLKFQVLISSNLRFSTLRFHVGVARTTGKTCTARQNANRKVEILPTKAQLEIRDVWENHLNEVFVDGVVCKRRVHAYIFLSNSTRQTQQQGVIVELPCDL